MPKEIVEILSGPGIKKRKKYTVKEDYVIIEKEKKFGKITVPSWCPSFTEDDYVYYHKRVLFWKVLKRKLMVKESADKCINLRTDPPTVPRMDIKKAFQASVLNKAGQIQQQLKVPALFYVLMVVLIILQIFGFLVSSGRVHFG